MEVFLGNICNKGCLCDLVVDFNILSLGFAVIILTVGVKMGKDEC